MSRVVAISLGLERNIVAATSKITDVLQMCLKIMEQSH